MTSEAVDLLDLTLTTFPKDKKVTVFSYGSIYQSETNYSIAVILKELYQENPAYMVSFINLKELFAFPLGTVIDNQRKIGLNSGSIDSFEINIHSGLLEQKKLKDIPKFEAFMEQIPAKINGYSALWHKYPQNYSVFTDTNGRTIIFPHYEIARYFYFTSSSMTRQLMAVSSEHNALLDGLYKKVKLENGKGELNLKFNANSNDAENIFRFVIDLYAKNMWHQVRRDLSASKITIVEEKKRRGFKDFSPEMILSANFPTYGRTNFTARVKNIDKNTLLVLRILQEDTFYPFESLKVIREFSNGTEDVVGVIKKKAPNKKNLTHKVKPTTPNTAYTTVNVIDHDADDSLEAKLDLLNKTIEFETKIIDEKEKDVTRSDDTTDKELDLSAKDAEGQGNLNTAEENLKEQDDDERDFVTLEDFKKMLIYCAEINDDFSYKILKDSKLPQKPEKDEKSRYQWKRSKLSDGITPRKYIVVEIKFLEIKFVVIEIQKDILVEAMSTLMIDDSHNNIDAYIIEKIILNIAKTSNSWLQGLDLKVKSKPFYHSREKEKIDIQDWGNRFIKMLKEYNS